MMKIIKNFLILVLVLTCIGGGVYYVLLRTKPEQLQTYLSQIQTLQPVIATGITQVAQNLPDISQMGKVLGVKNEIKSDAASLPQKTLEYARYTYCQQVIKDYQQRYASESATTP